MFFQRNSYNFNKLAKKWSGLCAQAGLQEGCYAKWLQLIADAVGAQGGCLILREGNSASLGVKACLDGRHFSFYPQDCSKLMQWLEKNRRGITRRQILEDSEYFPVKIHGLNFFLQFQAEACVPLFGGQERLAGILVVGPKKNSREYGAACLEVMEWFAAQLAPCLQNGLLTEELRRRQTEIDALRDLKSQMIANLSHELRTPLTSILGFAEILAEEIDGPLLPEQKRHVEEISDGGERLLRTLSALVDMAKIEAGQYPLNVSQFHLGPVLEGALDEIALNGEIDLEVSLNGHTPMVYGDLQMVRQVFRQLLDNAAKYTPRGKVTVSAGRKGEMLEICVADTGIGIAKEKLPEIFRGFYQISSGLTRTYQGPGIGLALSKKMVEAHGGRLWAESRPGQGSQFFFTLPLKPITIRHKELAA
ncbi:MAG: HAMP domain-containing histidine kinase [Deltaproteobacteria bacterium]|nr:HAMP domain-containing histidine kinase [Deltaproteobacteria bacterium]